ncbi:MAG: CDP-glycerol glycerophosphotransferase family protein [Saccharofermentans sp.]|nr:CDP-glycerol glycerophosphotransferase family protein [Saccharofermentans sp.]
MILYIDPGTGSMLFTVIIGAFSALVYLVKNLYMKIKLSAGKDKNFTIDKNKTPIIIYSDHKRYWNVFESICKELDQRGQKAVFYTSSPDDPALEAEFKNIRCEFIGEGNKGFSKLNMLNAYVVLATTPSLDIYQWKRSKSVDFYVHILHMVTDPVTYRMFGLDYYDAVLLSGEYQVNQLNKLWEGRNILSKDLRIVGNTYLDDFIKRTQGIELNKTHKKTVLLAPTWGPAGILSLCGDEIISQLLKTDFDIVIRPHPQSFTAEKELMESLMTKYPDSERLQWNRDNDNFECLSKADIMISDFSGVIFDFVFIFDKPVVYTDAKINRDIYDAYFLDDELWINTILPKIGKALKMEDVSNIETVLNDCMSSNEYANGRELARKEAWANQGKAASLVADYLINKYRELSGEEENSDIS